jgi:hypothetical protein
LHGAHLFAPTGFDHFHHTSGYARATNYHNKHKWHPNQPLITPSIRYPEAGKENGAPKSHREK